MTRELLFRIPRSAFRVDTFRSGGPGGQYQNKVSSGVRVTHLESGATGESRSERSQWQNKKLALQHLRASPKFLLWLNRKIYEHTHRRTVEEEVEAMMAPENLVIEVLDRERWVPAEEK